MKLISFLFLTTFLYVGCEPHDLYIYEETAKIELRKDPCFGFCPVYSFQLDGKGNARFNGKKNVSKEGDWVLQVSPELTNEIFQKFEKSNFWSFEAEYTAQVTDLPTTWVSFTLGEDSKTIKDYYGAPESLKKLEKLIENIAESDDGWVQSVDN